MWLCLIFINLLPFISATILNCTQINDQYWTQVWNSEFNNETELKNLWNIEHETSQCSRNGIEQANCNIRDNIEIIDGYAFIIAKHESYNGLEYTAATMTTKAAFTYGRFEIRARLPRGDFLRPSIFTRNDSELYWHELGQLDMGSYGQDSVLYRGIHYAHSTSKYQKVDLPFSSVSAASIRLGEEFHLYGVEWSEKNVRFFWDNSFSKWFNFTKETSMTPWHHIRLQVGVGGVTFLQKMPSNFSELNWICPSLIVDYVRIYEKIEKNECDQIVQNQNFGDLLAEIMKINSICEQYQPEHVSEPKRKDKINGQNAGTFQTTQLIIALMIILFAFAIFWMMVQLRSVRRKLDHEQTNNNQMNDLGVGHYSMPVENYKNNSGMEIYEEINNYQFDNETDITRYVPYEPLTQIHDEPNEYLQIHEEPTSKIPPQHDCIGHSSTDQKQTKQLKKTERCSNEYDVLQESITIAKH